MAVRANSFCQHPGCGRLASGGRYCDEHAPLYEAERVRKANERDKRRLSSRQRGYSTRWDKLSKVFLARVENQFCALQLDNGCTLIAQCVDHIDPPDNAKDPRFWDEGNYQPACRYCNSKKGHRKIIGTATFG